MDRFKRLLTVCSILSVCIAQAGCQGTGNTKISGTFGVSCEESQTCKIKAEVSIDTTLKLDDAGNAVKELYAYVGDEMAELDFSQFAINFNGNNAFVKNKPGDIVIVLKSFGNEIGRKNFAYHIDATNDAKLTDPIAVKNWMLSYGNADEFEMVMADTQVQLGGGQRSLTASMEYGASTYGSSTHHFSAGSGAETPELPPQTDL